MIIQRVRFRSRLDAEAVERTARERGPQFRALPGLIQKYYVREEDGSIWGLYLWDSMESLEAFRASELARTIPEAYAIEGEPERSGGEVFLTLRA